MIAHPPNRHARDSSPEIPVTSEPAQPISRDDAPPLAEPGQPAADLPAEWVGVDETPSGSAATWEADDGATKASPPATARPGVKGGKDDELDQPLALRIRKEPLRLSHLMIAIAVIAVICWMWVTLKMLLIVFVAIAAIVLLITAGFVLARLRTSRQDALLSLLAIAAERDMPLAPAVSAFADQFPGRAHHRVMDVVHQLNEGVPLPETLERPRRALSQDAILMAWVGHGTGRLAPALRLAGRTRAWQFAAWTAVASRLAYLLLVIMIAEAISGFVLYFITPKFEAIFADFGFRLPKVTVTVIRLSRFLFATVPIAALIVLAQLAAFLFIPFSFSGWMNYQAPIFDRLLSRRHAALVLRALSVVIEADKPIVLGLATLAEHYPARWVRRRLAKVQMDVRLGADWIDALWRAGVIRKSDAEVLASAASVGNLPWACRELADTADRRQQLRIQVVTQAIFPLAVVTTGAAIAFLAMGYFMPIVTIIRSLTDQ
jgi:type II secretory pathway component PulF